MDADKTPNKPFAQPRTKAGRKTKHVTLKVDSETAVWTCRRRTTSKSKIRGYMDAGRIQARITVPEGPAALSKQPAEPTAAEANQSAVAENNTSGTVKKTSKKDTQEKAPTEVDRRSEASTFWQRSVTSTPLGKSAARTDLAPGKHFGPEDMARFMPNPKESSFTDRPVMPSGRTNDIPRTSVAPATTRVTRRVSIRAQSEREAACRKL